MSDNGTGRYVKLPIPVYAMQLTDATAIVRASEWIKANGGDCSWATATVSGAIQDAGNNRLTIHTLEGKMTGTLGDWIVRGAMGEFWPVRGDIFAATYRPATAEEMA